MSAARGNERWAALEREFLQLREDDGTGLRAKTALLDTVQRALDELRAAGVRLERAERENAARARDLESLRESEERWRSIIENPFDYVCICDRDGLILYLNRTGPAHIHMEDVVGKQTIYEYTNPESHQAIRDAIAQVFDKGRPAYYETHVPIMDTWFGTVVGPIERDGQVVSASLLSRQMTAQKKAEVALRESEERFRQLTEHIEDVFFLYDPIAQETLYVSPAYEKLWGRPLKHVYSHGRAWLEGVHADDRPGVLERYERLRATCIDPKNATYSFNEPSEYRIQRPNGTVRWIRTRNFPIFDAAGNVTRVAGVATDITERRDDAQRLAMAEAKYRGLVEKLPVISYIAELGDDRKTLYISPQIETKLGFSQEQWTADPELWKKSIHPDDRARVMAEMRQFRRCGESLHSVYRLLSQHGDIIWFRDDAVLVQGEAGGCNIVEGVMLDVSDAEEARAEQQRARALSAHLVEVQENERRHIARELHDEIGQTLTGLKLMLEMRPNKGAVSSRLREARALVGELMEKVRRLSSELRPAMLDDLGLLPTLMSMFERFEKQTRVRVKFEHCAMEGRFDPDVETAVYRLAQEGLTNVARHAGVRVAQVHAWSDAEQLTLRVDDQGRGFDVAAALSDSGKNGLIGMRERVAALGGELTLDSKIGAGTRLTVQIPVHVRDVTPGTDGGGQ